MAMPIRRNTQQQQQQQYQQMQQQQQYQQMQQVVQPVFYQTNEPNYMQQEVQQDVEEIIVKSLWNKSNLSYAGAFKNKSEDDLILEADALLKEIRKDLDNLRLLNKSIVMATFIDIEYIDKEKEYAQTQIDIDNLSRQDICTEVVNELRIISHKLDLDISNIDVIFPQIVYSSIHMRRLMEITVKQIGYPEIKEEADVAYASLLSIEPHLKLDKLNDAEDAEGASIETAMRTINLLNEMRKFKTEILKLRDFDITKRRNTRKYVLLGMFVTLISLNVIILGLHFNGIEWNDIRNYPVLGIPLGIGIWSFIGSFAAMIQQFYQKSIYEFGDTFKWVLIRPVLGVLMGAAIYLAFSNGFGIDDNTGNGTFMYLVAFFVGLSDSFAVGIIDRLQGAISNSVAAPNTNQPTYLLASNTIPMVNQPQLNTQQPITTNNNSVNNNNTNNNNVNNNSSNNNNAQPIALNPEHNITNEGEDEHTTP